VSQLQKSVLQRLKPYGFRRVYVVAKATTYKDYRVATQTLPAWAGLCRASRSTLPPAGPQGKTALVGRSTERCATLTLWQAGAQPFEPAPPVLRMNRPAGRFTSSAPTMAARGSADGALKCAPKTAKRRLCGSMKLNRPSQIQKQRQRRGHGMPCPYDGKINGKVNGAQLKLAATKAESKAKAWPACIFPQAVKLVKPTGPAPWMRSQDCEATCERVRESQVRWKNCACARATRE
jgi:hypothetical protein